MAAAAAGAGVRCAGVAAGCRSGGSRGAHSSTGDAMGVRTTAAALVLALLLLLLLLAWPSARPSNRRGRC